MSTKQENTDTRRLRMPKQVAREASEGFPPVKVTVKLSGRNNRKIQELQLDGGGTETKVQIAERLLNNYLDTLPLKS